MKITTYLKCGVPILAPEGKLVGDGISSLREKLAFKGTCHFLSLLIWTLQIGEVRKPRLPSIGEIPLMQIYSSSPTMRR